MIRVLVDIDETALSLQEGINRKASAVMFKKMFGIDAHEEMIDNFGKTEMGIIQEVLRKVGASQGKTEREPSIVEIPEDAYKVWAQATAQELKDHPATVLPGIPELLTALSKNPKVKLGLLSGNNQWRAEVKLRSVSLDTFFRDPKTGGLNGVFGNMTERRDQLFDIIKKQANAEDRFIVVDDSLIGAEMAQRHNIPLIGVATGRATKEQLRHFTPHVFPDFGENRWQQAVSLIEAM